MTFLVFYFLEFLVCRKISKSKFFTPIFSSPIPGDKDDFAGVEQLLREQLEWQVGLEQMRRGLIEIAHILVNGAT